jgi:unsaturated chondroitin disaccharide hydrolase
MQTESLSRRASLAAFDTCVLKTRNNIRRLADSPKSAAYAVDGDYFALEEGFFDIGNWTSSFFTGMALLAWRQTEDEFFLNQTLRLAPHFRKKVFEHHQDTMHDLGFLYSLYSVALYKLTGAKEHREAGLRAAEVLANRFVPEGGYIRAWGRMDEANTEYAGLAIIDSMMNLPLLHWAAQESGDHRFLDIAISHADVTLKHFIRQDDSVFHAFRFDPKTGKPARPDSYCGYSVDSHWARGTAWAVYGFALSYGYTQDSRYINAARRLARKFADNLNGRAIPVWDFRLPAGQNPLRDSSAAAIAVCGIQELHRNQAADDELLRVKWKMLEQLCSSEYLDTDESCPGVLRNAQIGISGPGKAANAFTSWGDYYLMEALSRELELGDTWW